MTCIRFSCGLLSSTMLCADTDTTLTAPTLKTTHHENAEFLNNPFQHSTMELSQPDDRELPTFRREAGQQGTSCEGCYVAKAECVSHGTTCLRCLQMGLHCVRPFEDLRTSRTDVDITMETEDGPNPGLQAQSLTGPNSSYNNIAGSNATSAQESALQNQGPAGERPRYRSLQIDSVNVLSWPVFAGQFDQQAKDMSVLPQKHPERRQPSVSGLDRFLSDPHLADRLVLGFLYKVHIKSPLLDVLSLRSRAYQVYSAGIE